MVKRAIIIHGTDGNLEDLWLPWLKDVLEKSGYEVFFPLMPDNHKPNRHTYEKFLQQSSWDFEDSLVIGHSSGATTILNLLNSDWMPRIKAAVLVGVFLNENLVKKADWYEMGQFNKLFLKNYDVSKMLNKCDTFYFVHGDDDPYCDYQDTVDLCNKLRGHLITVNGGGHLAYSSKILELPQLVDVLKNDQII